MLKAAGARKGAGRRDRRGDARVAVGGSSAARSTRRTTATSRSPGRRWSTSVSTGCTSRWSSHPAHKETVAPAEYRLALARARVRRTRATVELELYEYTVDALEAARLRGSGLPDRRRRARRLPDLEGAGARARTGAPRCRDAPRLRSPRATSPTDRDLRARAVPGLLVRDPRARPPRASRSTGSCRTQSPGGSPSSVSTADA